VQDLPAGFDDSELPRALADGWDIAVTSVAYAPVGFGSYHWVVTSADQQRFFVTVDDLRQKAWLGDTCDSVFVGFQTAFDTAVAMRDRGGLAFVHAPLSTIAGESVRHIGRCHSIAVFAFIDGEAGGFAAETSPQHRAEVVRLLVELHQATPAAPPTARRLDIGFAGRAGLEAARNDLDRAWHGGPFAEPARALLASHTTDLDRLLTDFDQLAAPVAATQRPPVITHGEPHPGNVMRSHGGLVLIDWDTVGLALPERDLWMVADASGDEVAQYIDATGYEVSPVAMSLYRRAWDLAEIAVYIDQFRSPHQSTADTHEAWLNLESAIAVDQHYLT
jgi:spectinomycin phosphotransferase